jgi:hypothetical protein
MGLVGAVVSEIPPTLQPQRSTVCLPARFFSILSSSRSILLKLQLFQKGGYRNGRRSKRLSSGAAEVEAVSVHVHG